MKSDNAAVRVSVTQLKVFDWLYAVFPKMNEVGMKILKQEVLQYLNDMVAVDSDRTAKLVRDFYENEHRSIVNKLSNAPTLQLKYLAEIVKSQGSDQELEENLVLLYVKLLCELNPSSTLKFLMTNEKYSLDACLRLCLQYKVTNASAYLYERLGDTKDALDLYLHVCYKQILEEKQERLEGNMNGYVKPLPAKVEEDMNDILLDVTNAVDLCSRNASKLDEHDNEEHWFSLLDRVLIGYGQFKPHFAYYRASLEPALSSCVSSILSQMIVSVEFKNIVVHIAEHFGKIPFKHFKTDFVNVLSRYSYQKNILRKANSLLNRDIKNMTQELLNLRMKGLSSKHLHCASCGRAISSEEMLKGNEEKLLLFTCGHVYHSHCLKVHVCEVCKHEETRKGHFMSAAK